jgi:hypothetical protein
VGVQVALKPDALSSEGVLKLCAHGFTCVLLVMSLLDALNLMEL